MSVVLVPVLTMRGLATAQTIFMCAHGHYKIIGLLSPIGANNRTVVSTIPPPGECKDSIFDRLLLVSNATALDVVEDGNHSHMMVILCQG